MDRVIAITPEGPSFVLAQDTDLSEVYQECKRRGVGEVELPLALCLGLMSLAEAREWAATRARQALSVLAESPRLEALMAFRKAAVARAVLALAKPRTEEALALTLPGLGIGDS